MERPAPGRNKRVPSAIQGRRLPPPEATGLEAACLEAMMNARARLLVRLRDGAELRGRIDFHDREVIRIQPADGSQVMVRKADIRFLQED